MPSARRYAMFPTALGECAVAWNEIGLTAVWLPESDCEALRRAVARRCPAAIEAAPAEAPGGVATRIARLLGGEPVDFDAVALDESALDAFDRRVYAVARAIRPGLALTYGEVAARVGAGASARAVGQSLGRNRMPIVVPCHRVVATGSGLGGFSAPGGTATKQRLLAIEKARRAGPADLFDAPEERAGSGGQPAARH